MTPYWWIFPAVITATLFWLALSIDRDDILALIAVIVADARSEK